MIKLFILAIALCLASFNCYALEVKAVDKTQQYFAVEQSGKAKWNVNDGVCVYNKGNKVGCGKIVRLRDWGFMAKLEGNYSLINKGDNVKKIVIRKTASVSQMRRSNIKDVPTFSFALGSHIASSYVMPTLSIQLLVADHFAMGISPIINYAGDENGSAFGYGLQLSGNFYFGDMFDGLWLKAGAEYISTKASIGNYSESFSSVGGIFTFGYRFSLSKNVHLGLAMGGEYLTDPHFTTIDAGYVGAHGIGYFDFGFRL